MDMAFSEPAELKFQEIVGRYPTRRAALLPVLFLAQAEFGWISVEVMAYLADRLDLPPSQVLTTASFYTMYNKHPVGKCHIQVCTTLSCAFRGGYELLERFESHLGIKRGETTDDGNFTLTEVECLASCGSAPMFQLTDSTGEMQYFENVTSKKEFDAVVRELESRLADLPDPRSMH